MSMLKEFVVKKGDMQDLPVEMDMDTLYFGISSQEGGVSAMCVDGKIWPSKEYVDNETIKIKNATSLNFGEGLKKTVDGDGITISIDKEFLKEYIKLYSESKDGVVRYDVLKKVSSYVLGNEEHAWYDFTNVDKGIIRFDEPNETTPPSGTNEPNFGSHYLPCYNIELSEPLSLDATPVLNFEGFTLNQSTINFKFVDGNGISSNPIIIGNKNGNDSSLEYIANPLSHQERKTEKNNIVSPGYGGYTNAKTYDAITTQIDKLITEFESYGHYSSTKCPKVKVNLLAAATGVMNSGIGVDNNGMEDGFTWEEGFDRNNIVRIVIQCVEQYDKDTISWKERAKATIFNKFEFVEE